MKPNTLSLCRSALIGLTFFAALSAQANPHWGGGGYRGGGAYHHHHHGYNGGRWVAPALVGGVLLGAALTAPAYASPAYPVYPAYTVPYPPTVTYSTPVPPQPVGYYCPTSGQFYPYVPTCNVPWRLL
ncbi:MAG: hypothetical protein RIT26_2263 [Pseudomonadota bacterium]|jgi:hypothetical protein